MPATSSTSCIRSRYWRTNARQRGSGAASAKRFGPYFARRSATSAVVRPLWTSTWSSSATPSGVSVNHFLSGSPFPVRGATVVAIVLVSS